MRILFIHNNNLPLPILQLIYGEQSQGYSIKVIPMSQDSTDRDDYDTFIDKTLLSSLTEEHDLIVLPLSLSDINPLEFTGIRCAAHIRLDKRYRNTFTPILFLGPESLEEVLRLSELGSFLLTPSVFLSSANTVEQFFEWIELYDPIVKRLLETDYSRFLNRFEIKAPANFADDHHSIANLWGAAVLVRRITQEMMPSTVDCSEALHSLFFKYVLAKRDISEEMSTAGGEDETETLAEGKSFLLIDDEANKGWEFALSHYLEGAKVFDVISEKVSKYDDISDIGRTKIEKGDYDIIFLDLRLGGPDEECIIDPRSFSGMDVLRHIKEINRGTQVIMFTASNKAWNLKALMDEGVDGYYIKPSPEYYTDAFIDSNFESLRDTIKHCLNRSYLRFLYKRLVALKKICDNCLLSREYSNPIKSHLDVSFSLLSSAGNDAQYSYAFLALFGVLEEFVQYFITTEINGKTLYYYEDLKLDNNKVGNWTIRDNKIIKKANNKQ